MAEHAVLVTGGSGYLGQHVVKHIAMYMKEVTEIRVLDCNPYKQNLEYEAKTPVKTFIGSITDKQKVKTACHGVKCVFHIAAIVDVRMFPDVKAMNEVNVTGTEVIMDVCQEENVEYFVYCGTLSCFHGDEEFENGTETSVPFPKECKLSAYYESKRKALRLVINRNGSTLENGKSLKTVAILPAAMYGEQNRMFLDAAKQFKEGTQYRVFGKATAPQQQLYVGNAAMYFVQAYKSIQTNSELGGQYFFAADDTPPHTLIEIRHICLPGENPVLTPSSWYIPEFVSVIMFAAIYCILLFLRLFKDVNFPVSSKLFLAGANRKYLFNYDKAKTLLGYKPLYDFKTSVKNTKLYYMSEK